MFSPRTTQLQPVLTVSQLTACIRDVLESEFQQVYVVGEVSNAKVYPSGHWYFSLKDKDATLPAVCFRAANNMLKFKLEDGLMLVARGRMNVYPPRGAYQLVAESLEPVGIGEWQLAFEQLRDKLEKEGLLHPDRKKPIPMIPRRIGVVTSPAGAAVRDVISALSRRNRNVHIVVAPVKVQGDGSAEEIARAIDYLHRIPDIDVIILARGGGSIEDLWAFNTEIVARAVVDSAIPIISGVGHETDITICDLVADLRAPTPTAAAELVARGSAELLDKWRHLQKQMLIRTESRLTRARRDLDRLKPLHVLLRYAEKLKRNEQKVKHLRERMNRAIMHSLDRSSRKWQQQHEKLQALGPSNVLNRGYAIIKMEDGTIVRDSSNVSAGQELIAFLNAGKLRLRVEAINPEMPHEPPLKSAPETQLNAAHVAAAELEPKSQNESGVVCAAELVTEAALELKHESAPAQNDGAIGVQTLIDTIKGHTASSASASKKNVSENKPKTAKYTDSANNKNNPSVREVSNEAPQQQLIQFAPLTDLKEGE